MKRTIVIAAGLAFAATLSASPAHALNTRSFISANGLDTNSCARTAPCRTLQTAYNNTIAAGEINMLDPAGYGTVVITHAISIVNDGVGSAGVLVPSGQIGITINAGSDDAINLRGLIIEGAGVGGQGIQFNSGKSLVIQNCVVRNHAGNGLSITNLNPHGTDFTSGLASITVSNSYFTDNAQNGIAMGANSSGSSIFGSIDHVVLAGNGFAGLNLIGRNVQSGQIQQLSAVVTESIATHSIAGYGFVVQTPNNGNASFGDLLLIRSLAEYAGVGISAIGPTSSIDLAQSTLANNFAGFQITNATITSYGDNYLYRNGTSTGALSSASKQ